MTPSPRVTAKADAKEIAATLIAAGIKDVRIDDTTRAIYSTDASLYRLIPQAVVMPANKAEIAAVMQVCQTLGVPLTARGGGTSCAGNAVGPGIVMDTSRHMNAVLNVHKDGWADVEPGCVHATLQKQAQSQGWRFGPDPSSHTRCTIGGMIGNNACGSRALAYGKTSENILELTVLLADGSELALQHGQPAPQHPVLDKVRKIIADNLQTIRTEFGRFGRQVSGYPLELLLPENGFDVTRFLAGTEGTLALVTRARMRLVTDLPHRVLVALGYPDIAAAGDAAPSIMEYQPIAVEGMDRRLVDALIAQRGAEAVPQLPAGNGWLFVEIAGQDPEEVQARAKACAAGAIDSSPPRAGGSALDARVVSDPETAAALWRVREDGAGLAGRSPQSLPAWPGWEDAAVPPENLGDYLRRFDELLAQHGLSAIPYGHFGDGCMHVRIDFPLEADDGRSRLRAFLKDAAHLVADYGGSMSGEHGDGRARSEFLPAMYSAAALQVMAQIKAAFDPKNLLNPGNIVDPAPADAHVRMVETAASSPLQGATFFRRYQQDMGSFTTAIHRCTGVGKCRADGTPLTVMCPSYQATGEEKDSTRGRARMLQELANGQFITANWRSPAVAEALELCLSCKGCASDCPTGIDMAAYKSEVLHQKYKGKIRPRNHYALGQLPRWVRLGSHTGPLASMALATMSRFPSLNRIAGVDPRRSIPSLARSTFRSWCRRNKVRFFTADTDFSTITRPVLLLVDTFTNHFSPEVGKAMVQVLQVSGATPFVVERNGCCGLTWISTGQLPGARRQLTGLVADLHPAAQAGLPIIGIEPSCTAVVREEAEDLLADQHLQAAQEVARATRTLAEYLQEIDWQPPHIDDDIIVQPHCHHHAVMTYNADMALLERTGARLRRLGGCCGLAGNFGVELGHYEVSVQVASQYLLPALTNAPAATVLADGFSCRTQVADLTNRQGVHLAELLARHLPA